MFHFTIDECKRFAGTFYPIGE